jgi:hypothetical protein
VRGARPVALFAHLVAAYRHFCLGAEHRFFELQGDVLAQIGPPLRSTTTTPARTSTKKIAKTKKVPENIAEILEDTGIKAGSSRRRGTYASVPETVVQSALFLVSQNRVRFTALLKSLFRIRVIGIAVRMVLQGELAVSAFYLDVGSRTGYAENLVIITFTVRCRNRKLLEEFLVSGLQSSRCAYTLELDTPLTGN